MKLVGGSLLLVFVSCVGQAQLITATASDVHPTPLEAFAKQKGSRIIRSEEIGRIESSEANAMITALAVEDTAQPPDRLQGVRIDLSDQDGKDQVYLGEETLPAFRDALDQISRDAARGCEWNAGGVCPANMVVGSCLFKYIDKTPSVHTLTAGHYFHPGSSGLVLTTIGVGRFWFPNQDASLLSAAFGRAMDRLKQR